MLVHDLVSRVKVMYLAAFADGEMNDAEKDTINAQFMSLDLKGDALFISRKLAMKTRMLLEDDRSDATEAILIDLAPVADDSERAHLLMSLFLTVAESDGPLNHDERLIAVELADTLDLDLDYYVKE